MSVLSWPLPISLKATILTLYGTNLPNNKNKDDRIILKFKFKIIQISNSLNAVNSTNTLSSEVLTV